eukprot:SAG31_NODE_36406_length_313_cov_1.439252_1_plen_28_part_10
MLKQLVLAPRKLASDESVVAAGGILAVS